MVTISLALALVHQDASAITLRTLATNGVPTEAQTMLLGLPEREAVQAAKKAGIVVQREGNDILLWDENIYNIGQVEAGIRGATVMTRLAASGKTQFRLEELSAADRDDVRSVLLAQGVADLAGPAVFSDKVPILLEMSHQVVLESNGRKESVFIDPPYDAKIKSLPTFTNEEIDKFVKEELPKKKVVKLPVTQLHFKCSSENVTTERRLEAIQKLTKRLYDLVSSQNERSLKTQEALRGALGGDLAINAGQKVSSMPPSMLDQVRSALSLRIPSSNDRRNFEEGASISSIQARPMIRISWNSGKGFGKSHGVETRVRRGG